MGARRIGRVLLPLLILVAPPIDAQQRPPIIDMHLHAPATILQAPGGQPLSRFCVPEPCERVPAAAKTADDVLRLTLEAMERHNIVLGFVSDSLESVEKWVAAAPTRFIPSRMISDPTRADLDVLRKRYDARTLRGMGELTNQYQGIAANDPIMDPVFALAAEFDVPVLVHSEGAGAPSARFRIAQGHPELLQDVLVRHPSLRLYLENAGFPFLEETIALLYRYPNVHADLSTITWIVPRAMFHSYLRRLVDAGHCVPCRHMSCSPKDSEVLPLGATRRTRSFRAGDSPFSNGRGSVHLVSHDGARAPQDRYRKDSELRSAKRRARDRTTVVR
jgi:uncharacterized protein